MPVAAPPEVKEAAVAAYVAGQSCKEIAAQLGVSHTAVSKWVVLAVGKGYHRAHGCKSDGCREAHHARGYCRRHYSEIVGGRAYRGPFDIDSRLEDLRWMADTGESLVGAARRIGVTVEAIRVFLNRHGETDLLATLTARNPREHNHSSNLGRLGDWG